MPSIWDRRPLRGSCARPTALRGAGSALALTTAALFGACAFDASGLPRGVDDGGTPPSDAEPPPIDAAIVPTTDGAPPVDAEPPPIDAEPPPIDAADPKPDAAPPIVDCPDSSDLVACYRFEVDLHDAQPHDDSGNDNDGDASGVSFPDGRPGHGTAMNTGGGSAVMVPDSDSLDLADEVTLELWIRPDTLPGVGGRAGLIDNNNQYGLFLEPGGAVRCAIGAAFIIGLDVPAGTWTHVGCTYDGARIQLYQDAAPGDFTSTMIPIPTTSSEGLGLGQSSPSGEHFDGTLDDVHVWRVALDEQKLCEAAGLCP